MKKFVALFFLIVYGLSATQLCELIKVPFLVEHYLEHKQENKDISVLGFLYLHYAKEQTKDADYEKDMKLPFKSITQSGSSSFAFCIPFQSIKQSVFLIDVEPKQFFSEYYFSFTPSYLSAIWQPPKNC